MIRRRRGRRPSPTRAAARWSSSRTRAPVYAKNHPSPANPGTDAPLIATPDKPTRLPGPGAGALSPAVLAEAGQSAARPHWHPARRGRAATRPVEVGPVAPVPAATAPAGMAEIGRAHV